MKSVSVKSLFAIFLAFIAANKSTPADTAGNSALYGIHAFASDNAWAAGYKYQGNLSFPLTTFGQ